MGNNLQPFYVHPMLWIINTFYRLFNAGNTKKIKEQKFESTFLQNMINNKIVAQAYELKLIKIIISSSNLHIKKKFFNARIILYLSI